MAIEFMLECGCAVRQEVEARELIRLIKLRGQVKAIVEKARRAGNETPPEELTVTRVFVDKQGQKQEQQVSLQPLIKETIVLERYEEDCDPRRPANLIGEPFGCFGRISYPVLAVSEQWLMSLLPDSLNTTAGVMLRNCVKQLGYDGSMLRPMRGKPAFFEHAEPVTTRWGEAFALNSSQLLQMMFCMGTMRPDHCALLALFLGLIPHDVPPDDLRNLKRRAEVMEDIDVPQAPAADAPQLVQVAHFLRALKAAASLNVSLMVQF
jgi:hypothetical protein